MVWFILGMLVGLVVGFLVTTMLWAIREDPNYTEECTEEECEKHKDGEWMFKEYLRTRRNQKV